MSAQFKGHEVRSGRSPETWRKARDALMRIIEYAKALHRCRNVWAPYVGVAGVVLAIAKIVAGF
ncbi:hypothetical protein [Actinomadura sp. WMMA1423]|uniref:hypothetical protein n=1 Tax=Actinomadura sp. WMMA1423 TaxID=2591108 RepID=UPI00143CCF5D|nr:hypothetical protein [Actinomadura sp. WMMA1423]